MSPRFPKNLRWDYGTMLLHSVSLWCLPPIPARLSWDSCDAALFQDFTSKAARCQNVFALSFLFSFFSRRALFPSSCQRRFVQRSRAHTKETVSCYRRGAALTAGTCGCCGLRVLSLSVWPRPCQWIGTEICHPVLSSALLLCCETGSPRCRDELLTFKAHFGGKTVKAAAAAAAKSQRTYADLFLIKSKDEREGVEKTRASKAMQLLLAVVPLICPCQEARNKCN